MLSVEKRLRGRFAQITSADWEKEGQQLYLRVSTSLTSLSQIKSLSRQISDYLDEIDAGASSYILDVFSASASN
ncbi:hypothetical protein [Mycoplasma sp. ATU-Cv-703]